MAEIEKSLKIILRDFSNKKQLVQTTQITF
jgi:hypothetical protein